MSESISTLKPPTKLDYSLIGENAAKAVEKGLAEADWYHCPVPRAKMRALLERKDGPALRDTCIWFTLIISSAAATVFLWGTWWAAIPYLAYAVLYASTSDSRWHEAGHGTAFRTDWMNNALYEIASFMVLRESTIWRWSHTRHHSDTIIVGRDPEIAVPRPPNVVKMVLGLFALKVYPAYFKHILLHSFGRMTAEEKTFVPESEFSKVFFRARIYLAIYLGVIGCSIYLGSILPLLFVGLPNLFGSWLMSIYGLTQHCGLAENVLDHRLNCRTVYMSRLNRFLYWNMNYHVEHHMFPLVPYHALPQLHEEVKNDCPDPYPSLLNAWKEIIPTVARQIQDPAYYVKRKLPPPSKSSTTANSHCFSSLAPDTEGWVDVCESRHLPEEDVIRFDHNRKTFAIIRDLEGALYATDGICTHGNTHLADGLVKGRIIECPKHNGRFNLADGSPARAPICRGLVTYPVREHDGRIHLNVRSPGGSGARANKTVQFRVVSNANISTFIKELVLEQMNHAPPLLFTPGDYLQLDIPAYDRISFASFQIEEPYAPVWHRQNLFDLEVTNPNENRRNNYSIASNQKVEKVLRFNVRIATPPPGQDCPPGVGSSYIFNLKPGDAVTGIGPFGNFHIKPTQKEMIYIGGGAGMAPLRAHLSHLFETEKTERRISYWYGARSKQELYYTHYFQELADTHPNFRFHPALSAPLPQDNWEGFTGFIHEVVFEQYLKNHLGLNTVEFYLCGPPMMIKACTKMLDGLGVKPSQIAYDEF